MRWGQRTVGPQEVSRPFGGLAPTGRSSKFASPGRDLISICRACHGSIGRGGHPWEFLQQCCHEAEMSHCTSGSPPDISRSDRHTGSSFGRSPRKELQPELARNLPQRKQKLAVGRNFRRAVIALMWCSVRGPSPEASQPPPYRRCRTIKTPELKRCAEDHAEPELPRLLAASERATLLTSPPLPPGSRDRRARCALACDPHYGIDGSAGFRLTLCSTGPQHHLCSQPFVCR